jgi:acyl-CoA dehydrogenase
MGFRDIRRDWITRRIFGWARTALPGLSETERQALEAGDTWWDAALFTGTPDWRMLLDTPRPVLTDEEAAFLDGPCARLCDMVDDWDLSWHRQDLPPQMWSFLRENGFFGMIIPKDYGGLGFSAYAQSEIIRRISTSSVAVAVTVMVPNSLGPGELLLQYGTEEQKRHWLPRLADGREIPCFGLTSPEAGSDAASMTDTGIVTRQERDGESVLGLRLNWHKRYITLGPVATVLGLAFKTRDPDRLLGDRKTSASPSCSCRPTRRASRSAAAISPACSPSRTAPTRATTSSCRSTPCSAARPASARAGAC